jgi:hypothetical protein
VEAWKNGVSKSVTGTGTIPSSYNASAGSWRLAGDTGAYMDGDIAAVLIYYDAVSNLDLAGLHLYLTEKYLGISLTAPAARLALRASVTAPAFGALSLPSVAAHLRTLAGTTTLTPGTLSLVPVSARVRVVAGAVRITPAPIMILWTDGPLRAATIAWGSISVPTTGLQPNFLAAMAKMPEPQP